MCSRRAFGMSSPGAHAHQPTPLSGWFRLAFLFECSEGEKGESRPMKDRLCPGTTPYSESIRVPRG